MMFIDQKTLENSLHYIEETPAPSSATAVAAILLAKVQEAEDAKRKSYLEASAAAATYERIKNGSRPANEDHVLYVNGIDANGYHHDDHEYPETNGIHHPSKSREAPPPPPVLQNGCASVADSEETQTGSVITLEGDDCDYVIQRVAKQKQRRSLPRSAFRPPPLVPLPKLKRRQFLDNSSQSTASSHRRPPPGIKPINGYVPPHLIHSPRAEECSEEEEEDQRTVNEQNGLSDNETTLVNGVDSQMGFDVLNKLRKFLHLTSANDSKKNAGEQQRKRRPEDSVVDAEAPQRIKYRKVESRFPKYYTHKLEEDDAFMIPAPNQPSKQRRKPPYQHRLPFEMAQRRSLHPMEAPKTSRKSIFMPPQTTHKLIRNAPFADIEFSDDDDDEPELIKGFGMGGAPPMRAAPQVVHVPIRRHGATPRFGHEMAAPPPPLIDANTGRILSSSLVPELNNIRRPTYADAVRQGPSMFNRHLLDRRPGSSASSSNASTASSAQGGTVGWGPMRRNTWSTNAHSILAKQKEDEDHHLYQKLLEQLMPTVYHRREPTVVPRKRSVLVEDNTATSERRPSLQQASQIESPYYSAFKQPPLSSTINVEDDPELDDDVRFTGFGRADTRPLKKRSVPTVVLDDDDEEDKRPVEEISEIINLDNDPPSFTPYTMKQHRLPTEDPKKPKKIENEELPYVEPVNSLLDRFATSPHMKENWLSNLSAKWQRRKAERDEELRETQILAEKCTRDRRAAEAELHARMRHFQIIDPDLLLLDELIEPESEEEPEYFELSEKQKEQIKQAIHGPQEQVLISKFNLNIARRDISTLLGLNWLNDEVINFYMNLIMERSEKKHESHQLPTVYAMNTFFVPRLLQVGYSGVRRWTRKVDIFAKDVIPVPVHVGGVHWCMAIIHMKNRTIKYYDSMGSPNPDVLTALEKYLKEESMDKRKEPFDTSDFQIESVQDLPRQKNGSDCGVFSCMFAEYITRNRAITFEQKHMEYFRQKMILEITTGELLQ